MTVSIATLRLLATGMATMLPGAPALSRWRKASYTRTASADASYCYNVWLKHLALLHHAGMESLPNSIAELGPGSSLGVGLCALLCGGERYLAMDAVRYNDPQRSLIVLDELVALLRERRPWRDGKAPGWPDVREILGPSGFPDVLLPPEQIEAWTAPERLAAIRASVAGDEAAAPGLRYVAPWDRLPISEIPSFGLALSHSVLEHVTDLETTYRMLAARLTPGGWMSHQIDFRSHGLTPEWNGHWQYGPRTWRVILGRRPFLINRAPASVHLGLLRRNGFEIIQKQRSPTYNNGIRPASMAPEFRGLSEEDLNCPGLFVIARQRA